MHTPQVWKASVPQTLEDNSIFSFSLSPATESLCMKYAQPTNLKQIRTICINITDSIGFLIYAVLAEVTL